MDFCYVMMHFYKRISQLKIKNFGLIDFLYGYLVPVIALAVLAVVVYLSVKTLLIN